MLQLFSKVQESALDQDEGEHPGLSLDADGLVQRWLFL